jgi:hypothetical protein
LEESFLSSPRYDFAIDVRLFPSHMVLKIFILAAWKKDCHYFWAWMSTINHHFFSFSFCYFALFEKFDMIIFLNLFWYIDKLWRTFFSVYFVKNNVFWRSLRQIIV